MKNAPLEVEAVFSVVGSPGMAANNVENANPMEDCVIFGGSF